MLFPSAAIDGKCDMGKALKMPITFLAYQHDLNSYSRMVSDCNDNAECRESCSRH